MNQINGCGERAASRYEGMTYGHITGESLVALKECLEISKRENFYQREYCGCVYSLRDTNKWRLSKGRKEIEIGKNFYGMNGKEESIS